MKGAAPLHTQKECGYPLAYKQLKNKYQRQIAIGNFVSALDPMSCSEWIATKHFLIC